MSLADVVAALVVVGLTAYLVLACADFGAGLWDLTAGGARRGARVRGMVERSMSPVWEANHVWLIFVLVVLWTCFPRAFGSIASTLAVPLFLVAVGIILRGSAFAFRGVAATIAQQRALGALFALSSVITPFFMGAAIGGVASGRVPLGNAAGDPVTSWWNPTSVLIGALVVAAGAYLAAVYMAADARSRGLGDLAHAFRARALGAGLVAGGLAVGGLLVVREDAPALYDGLTGEAAALVVVSGAAGIATLGLVWSGAFRYARVSAAVAVGAIVWGWAVAQHPDILPGALTIEDAAAGRPTLVATLVAMGVGALVLAPSLALLYLLTLRGRLDAPFRPIGTTEGEDGP